MTHDLSGVPRVPPPQPRVWPLFAVVVGVLMMPVLEVATLFALVILIGLFVP